MNIPIGEPIKVLYKNWKGEEKIRTIIPKDIYFGSTNYHKQEQWLIKVFDVEKQVERTYALKDIKEWFC